MPSGQSMHSDAVREYVPAGQAVQFSMPVLGAIWPGGHSRHESEACAGWYFDTGQRAQVVPVKFMLAAADSKCAKLSADMLPAGILNRVKKRANVVAVDV